MDGIYSKDSVELVKLNVQKGMTISEAVRDMCIDLGFTYEDKHRRHFSRLLNVPAISE